MIEKLTTEEMLSFSDLTKEEKERRGILGVLYGPIASVVRPTRNGRRYSEELWARIFDEGLPKELLDKGGIPGELDHPEGRVETCPDRIAIMMPEKPKKDSKGHLVARFDIIDTPCGKIAYSLAKYGFKLGVSSRGDGTVEENFDGTEEVNPKDYKLSAFDLVLVPACEDARLDLLKESLDTKKQELRKELKEALSNATQEQKEAIHETLAKLKIDYPAQADPSADAAVDDGADVVEDLQKALKDNIDLQTQIRDLQEKLSVSYAKEVGLEEQLSKYRSAVIQLGEGSRECKSLRTKVADLEKHLAEKDEEIAKHSEARSKLLESKRVEIKAQGILQEKISQREATIKQLEERIQSLTESLEAQKDAFKQAKETSTESLQEARKNFAIKQKELTEKLQKANKLVENYRKVANSAVDRYIECKATMLGVNTSDIRSKLSEKYSFKDIDAICESLMSYSVNVRSLPVELTSGKTKLVAKTSINESIRTDRNVDDDVDASLLRLAGISH